LDFSAHSVSVFRYCASISNASGILDVIPDCVPGITYVYICVIIVVFPCAD
jgi:hypothetical protein